MEQILHMELGGFTMFIINVLTGKSTSFLSTDTETDFQSGKSHRQRKEARESAFAAR